MTKGLGWLNSRAGNAPGVLLCLVFAMAAHAQSGYSEDTVIAAYLYRFTGYIDWPQEAIAGHPFVIDVYDDPEVAQALRRLLPGHLIRNETAQVREVSRIQDLGDAQILYVGAGHADFLRALDSNVRRSMIIVTADEQGLDLGSVFNFVTVDKRVRFEISLTAAERAGIKISPELLSVAIRVHGGRRQSGDLCVPSALPQDGDAACNTRQAELQRAMDNRDRLPNIPEARPARGPEI